MFPALLTGGEVKKKIEAALKCIEGVEYCPKSVCNRFDCVCASVLAKALRPALKDKERLDFIEAHPQDIQYDRFGGKELWCVWEDWFPTLRRAIDSARAAEGRNGA